MPKPDDQHRLTAARRESLMKKMISLVILGIALFAGAATVAIMQPQAAGQQLLGKQPSGIAATRLRICGDPGPHPSMRNLTC
jgi:hypothetical protein